ncbi:DUF4102 domain-containing protein [Verticiella sediminum]|uniref:DUF4102 domain-containing protein n=1 Tax=Verticiella sediminum TaxID=1247510 RepID=A0A556A6M5_9BURK|nr:integrase arm-type DNA-binding domain-containing protein [Verticiella sediminum]TSH88527.1 DUF4102 domain-containing protein [Verticiella sediminum]
MATHLLTARKVETAAPQDTPYSLRDGGSLLYVTPKGSKLWRYRYRIGESAQVFAIGRFPDISLQAARRARDDARALVLRGIHPLVDRKTRLSEQVERNRHTFERVARLWMVGNGSWSRGYAYQVRSYLERDVFPVLGKLPIASITVSMLRPLVMTVAERGATAAMAVRQWLSQIFVYAAQQGWCEHDPAELLKRLVRRPAVRHNPPLPWHEIPRFMQKLDAWNGHLVTRIALRLVAYTFVRTIEIRRATWDQIDLGAAIWSIPAEHMKMRRPHTVPLSRQVIALLEALREATGGSRYVLPHQRGADKPIGAGTLNHAIEVLGYHGQFSTHGFRSTATTLLGLLSYPENRVDLQLAHVRNASSRAPYDHTKYVSSRRLLMQDWADVLDALAAGETLDAVTADFGPLSDRRAALLRVVEREQ